MLLIGKLFKTSFVCVYNKRTSRISNFKMAQKHRVKLPTIPCIIELVAIGGGKGGTCRSLIVNMSHFKYMFNCGEGTQRIATEHKMLRHTSNIFITSGTWNNIGGLMGLCLTLESADVKCLQVYGPPKVENYISASRNFSKLKGLELVKNEISDVAFEDSAMNIKFVKLNKSILKESNKIRKLDPSSDIEISIVYICQPHKKPRSISLELCAKHDVPVGPHLQLLKEGKEINLPGSGKLIQPDDILLPDEPNPPFIVLECPTIEYIDALITNEILLKYQNNDCSKDENFSPCAIVHFTPSIVMQDSRYISWLKLFGNKVDHLVLNDDSGDLDSEGVHRYQAQLNLLNQNIFPLLYHQTECVPNNDKSFQNITYMKTNMKYQIRPITAEKINSSLCIKLNFEKEKEKILGNDEIKKILADVQIEGNKELYPQILFLGTGSATPNKYRNVSSILLNISSEISMILDCGENTFGQLYRHLGPLKTLKEIKKLKCVFISHLHADHHLGLIGLAINRYNMFMEDNFKFEPLTIIAPGALLKWYTSFHSSMIPILDYVKIIPAEELIKKESINDYSKHKLQLLEECELTKISTVKVIHRQCPHGIILELKSGLKLVYSGDTIPSENLINAGLNCDVLIHEATFDDFKFEEAKEKRHSTTSQAIEVGTKMNAKFTILTHFSQRYDKLPLINEHFTDNVGVAFDNMRVRCCDLQTLSKLIPILMVAFSEDYAQTIEVQQHKYLRRKFFDSVSKANIETNQEKTLNI